MGIKGYPTGESDEELCDWVDVIVAQTRVKPLLATYSFTPRDAFGSTAMLGPVPIYFCDTSGECEALADKLQNSNKRCLLMGLACEEQQERSGGPLLKPSIQTCGMVATHCMPCCVHHDVHAQLDIGSGVFQPSLKAQAQGWITVQLRSKWLWSWFSWIFVR